MSRVDDKVAIITGGARGMGAAHAQVLIAAGAQVIITDVLDDVGAATADRLGDSCTFLHHDVTSPDDWEAVVTSVVEQFGRVDTLVNNAGIFAVGGVTDTQLELWDRMVAVNQTGAFLGLSAVADSMKANGSGSIINVSSIAGMIGTPRSHAYAATKWAVRGMTKSAAVELARHGIRVNSVHPGIIDTEMLHEFGDGWRPTLEAQIPLGRVAEPEEVSKLVCFLASEDSSYYTGQEFVVDGGMTS